MVAVIIIV